MKAPIFVVFLVIFSTVSSEQHSHEDHRHKKEQLGFFGSRGRRSAEDTIDPTVITTTENENGESQQDVRQLSSLRDAFMNLQRSVRAPKGFFGMRGKKDYDETAYDKRALIQQNLNSLRERSRFIEPTFDELNGGYPSFIAPKRTPAQGFFGVRGKKFGDYDMVYNNMMNEKRAPSGFVGMRGKKSNLDMFDENEIDDPQVFDYNYHEKRAPSGFMGVRGKRMYDNAQPSNNFMYR